MGGMLNQLARSRLRSYPENLFRGGAQGAWFDPSDFSTMFQDRVGNTPVTALGQPVGLILDKSKGLTQTEIPVTNGGFDTDTDWTKHASVSISGGTANFDGVTSVASATALLTSVATVPVVAYRWYKITYTVTGNTTANISVGLGTSASGPYHGQLRNLAGTYTDYVCASASDLNVVVLARSTTGVRTGGVDNISIVEVSGNHAYQTTTTSRQTIEARVNRCASTHDLSLWSSLNIGVGSIQPDGSQLLSRTSAAANCFLSQGTAAITNMSVVGTRVVAYIDVKAGGGASNYYGFRVQGTYPHRVDMVVDLATGDIVYQGSSTWTLNSASVSAPDEDGFRRLVLDCTSVTSGFTILAHGPTDLASAGWEGARAVLSTAYARRPQIAFYYDPWKHIYQQVINATTYTDIGAARYLLFDGTDDGLETENIDFTGTDAVAVFAGVRKNADSFSPVAETSASAPTNNGNFYLACSNSPGATFGFLSRGTSNGTAVSLGDYPAPISSVITGIGDISSDTSILRVDGVQKVSVNTDQGTGNYSNSKLYIGRRGGTTSPFNGRLYGLALVGAIPSAAQIAACEKHMAMKQGRAI